MKPLGTNVIVNPLYDPPTVETGLSPGAPALYMPDSGKNPMSQQGIVTAVGPDQEVIHVGDHILYHPFVQSPFRSGGREHLVVSASSIVGCLSKKGDLLPLPWDVLVLPDFQPAGRPVPLGLLWIPKQVFDTEIPCTGRVERTGWQVTSVDVGNRVLFPPDAGSEVGLRRVWYIIHEKDILATVESDLPITIMEWGYAERGNQ